jgi:hypothetical protein
VLLLLLGCADPPPPPVVAPPSAFTRLEPGVERALFPLNRPSHLGAPGEAKVLRIDPKVLEIGLQMASALGIEGRTGPEWMAADPAVVALINPSMYREDYRSAVGALQAGGHVNQATAAEDQRSWLLGQPRHPGLAPFWIVRDCAADPSTADFGLLAQSIRMLDCEGAPTWAPQPRRWSAALVGQDAEGKALFIHVRAPYAMRDLTEALLALPLSLVALHYGEGGPEATLCLREGGAPRCKVGSYETGFFESDTNTTAYPVPNVLVARRR